MPWIESHQSLARHPKLIRLARRLKLNKAHAIGHLHLLWWWTLDYAPSGDVSAFTSYELAIGAEWSGDGSRFEKALIEEGFIDVEGSTKVIHGWHDYAGKYVIKREVDRARKRDPTNSNGVPSEFQWKSQAPTNQTNQPTNPPDAGGGAGAREELKLAGVSSGKRIDACCAIPGISALGVALLAEEVRKGKQVVDVGAVVSSRILEGYKPPRIGPKEIYQLAKAGRLESVCGHFVAGKLVKYGNRELFIGDDRIAAADLTPENITLTHGENGATH